MYASALMAFLHHLSAFTLVGTLAAEVVLFKPPPTVPQARRLKRTDQPYGAASGVLLGYCVSLRDWPRPASTPTTPRRAAVRWLPHRTPP